MRLNELIKGRAARVAGVDADDPILAIKLRQLGFAEGDHVERLYAGPFGAAPLGFRLNRTVVALRAEEAAAIHVELETDA
ncbi:MAG: FeoA family protein [Maricaulaceae bacterium]